jgi:hypothetical protein
VHLLLSKSLVTLVGEIFPAIQQEPPAPRRG